LQSTLFQINGRFRTGFHTAKTPDAFPVIIPGYLGFVRFSDRARRAHFHTIVAKRAIIGPWHRFFHKQIFYRR
jgi:hypothetical protein